MKRIDSMACEDGSCQEEEGDGGVRSDPLLLLLLGDLVSPSHRASVRGAETLLLGSVNEAFTPFSLLL